MESHEVDYWGDFNISNAKLDPAAELKLVAEQLNARSAGLLIATVVASEHSEPTLYPHKKKITGIQAVISAAAGDFAASVQETVSPLDDVIAVNQALYKSQTKARVFKYSLRIEAPALEYLVVLLEAEHLILGPPAVLKSDLLKTYAVITTPAEFSKTVQAWTKQQRTQILIRTLLSGTRELASGFIPSAEQPLLGSAAIDESPGSDKEDAE